MEKIHRSNHYIDKGGILHHPDPSHVGIAQSGFLCFQPESIDDSSTVWASAVHIPP